MDFAAGSVMKTSLSPALKSTAEPLFELDKTVVRASVVPEDV
jgi:hypothetical protein